MEIEDVYRYFQRAKSIVSGRGYKFPKDFQGSLAKMSDPNRAALYKITDYFNTKWHNVVPDVYFACGFEMIPKFTYIKFFDPRIMKLYIHKDKNKKRDTELTKKSLISSAKYVKNFMVINNINSFVLYCNCRQENKCLPVIHYLSNNIDGYFLTWLLYSQLVNLSEDEKSLIPYIMKNYRENVSKLLDVNDFLKKLKEKL